MEKTCLNKTLKAVVENYDLDVLNSFKCTVLNGGSSHNLTIQNKRSEFMVILPVGEYITSIDGVEQEQKRVYKLSPKNSDYIIVFSNNTGVDYDVTISNVQDVAKLTSSGGVNKVTIGADTTPFRVNHVLEIIGAANFLIGTFKQGCSLVDFCHSPRLTYINGGNNTLGGKAEDMVEALWNAGKRSDTVYCNILSGITLNNVVLTYTSFQFKFTSSSARVTNGSTTLATYDGSSWTYNS